MSALSPQVYVRIMKNASTTWEDILVSVNKAIGEVIEETVKVYNIIISDNAEYAQKLHQNIRIHRYQ